jgi:hypothetical protein
VYGPHEPFAALVVQVPLGVGAGAEEVGALDVGGAEVGAGGEVETGGKDCGAEDEPIGSGGDAGVEVPDDGGAVEIPSEGAAVVVPGADADVEIPVPSDGLGAEVGMRWHPTAASRGTNASIANFPIFRGAIAEQVSRSPSRESQDCANKPIVHTQREDKG